MPQKVAKAKAKISKVTNKESSVSSEAISDAPTIDILDDSDDEDVTIDEIINNIQSKPAKDPVTKPLKVNVKNLYVDEVEEVTKSTNLIDENKALRNKLTVAKSELKSLEVKIPKMISDFKIYLQKAESRHADEIKKLQEEHQTNLKIMTK